MASTQSKLRHEPTARLHAAYQEGVNQDVRILTRLGHSPPTLGGDLGPVHAVMAPWLDRVGFRFVHQLCPMLLLSYAFEYGRVDLVRELVATQTLCFAGLPWTLYYWTWRRCVDQHRSLQRHYIADRDGNIYDSDDAVNYGMHGDGSCIYGLSRHLAIAACLGDHVDLLRFVLETSVDRDPMTMQAVALRAGRLGIVQDFWEKGAISSFTARDMRNAVASGSTDLVASLLDNSSDDMLAEAFDQATAQNQLALLQWLCATYNDRTYWHIALRAASIYLRHDVIEYFATVHDLHLTPTEVAWVHRRRKRLDDDEPARVTRSRN